LSLPAPLRSFLTTRFVKFCAVGASGVVVNLGILASLTALAVQSSLASACAIQVSIGSNFAVNEMWTFRDQRGEGTWLSRMVRFEGVSLVGALIQWSVFIAGNIGLLWLMEGQGAVDAYFAVDGGWFGRYVRRPITAPPDVGHGIYLAQLAGIGVATGWNFLANVYWTWRHPTKDEPAATQ
jgi:putative flippase GtrA